MQAAVRTRGLGWSMFWALVSYLVTTVGTMLANYLTPASVSPVQGSLISTGVGLGVVMTGVLIDRAKSKPLSAPEPPPQAPAIEPLGAAQRGTMPWVVAILLVLVLCGCGGVAVTYAAQWVGGKVVAAIECQPSWKCKETEPSMPRLAQPVTRQVGYLTVTVSKVDVTERAVLVTFTARNGGPEELSMPVCQLTIPGARTLQRDTPAGDWAEGAVPAKGERTGLLVFDGVIEGKVTDVTLAFTQIFSLDLRAPRNISIDIPLITTS